MGTLKVIVAIVVVAAAVSWGISAYSENRQQRRLVDEVRGLVDACKSQPAPASIAMRSKALVWDVRSDSRSGAHGRLPSELRVTGKDERATVFLVLGERTEQVGTYSISRQPAYREYIDVCVAYWPEGKAVGVHSVVSRDPRSRRPVQHSPEYGDPNEPIATWVASLPRQ